MITNLKIYGRCTFYWLNKGDFIPSKSFMEVFLCVELIRIGQDKNSFPEK